MAPSPDYRVIGAFLAPVTRLRYRMEIYENDGKTPWRRDLWDRLIDGSISAEFERDEKYACEFALDNGDGALNHHPRNLWYDKVYKPFVGVEIREELEQPLVMVVEATGLGDEGTTLMRMRLLEGGYTNVQVNTTAQVLSDISAADIVVFAGLTEITKTTLLQNAYNSGKSVLIFCTGLRHVHVPFMFTASTQVSVDYMGISPNYDTAHLAASGWGPWWASPQAPMYRLTPAADTQAIGRSPQIYGTVNPVGGVWAQERHGARAVAIQFSDFADFAEEPPSTGDPFVLEAPTGSGLYAPGTFVTEDPPGSGLYGIGNFHEDAQNPGLYHLGEPVPIGTIADSEYGFSVMAGELLDWLDIRSPMEYWEIQVGEYQADSVETPKDDDSIIQISARDYAKRCMGSKLANATAFSAATPIRNIITAVAANAGISKMNVPPMPELLGIDTTFEADTERWEIIKQVCTAHNYEVYFNHEGYLVTRKYHDPLATPPTLELTEGRFGNLVSVGSRANDSRLFNHVIVRGESNDRNIPPVAAEALNNNQKSPASIQRIGDRVKTEKSSVITTNAQAQELANSLLRVSSLEEFEINFDAVAFPWIEPGEIVELKEQRSGEWWPTRYMISSITIPFDLSPMSGTGKRVTIVL